MNKVPDRAKMRREYLGRKAAVNVQKMCCSVLMVTCGMVAWLCASSLLVCLILNDWKLSTVALFGLLVSGFFALFGRALVLETGEKERLIPYIPPVREQISSLPAEEVLLRGSQASAASSEELLRPAGKVETKAEELLRATTGGNAE